MFNPLAIVKDIHTAAKGVKALKEALPQIRKAVEDVKAAYAARGNAEAEEAALETLVKDVHVLAEELSALFPPEA